MNLDIFSASLSLVFSLALPLFGSVLAAGITVSLLQGATRIEDCSFSFTAKIVALLVCLYFLGGTLLENLIVFTGSLWASGEHFY